MGTWNLRMGGSRMNDEYVNVIAPDGEEVQNDEGE